MKFVFWCLWIFDLLLLIFNLWAISFRSGFGAGTGQNMLILAGLLAALVVSILLFFSSRPAWIALLVAAFPLMILLIMYIVDKMSQAN